MTIRRVAYNEMVCDGKDCDAAVRVYEGAPVLKEWTWRCEGPSGMYGGKPGGYCERHYCPSCDAASNYVATTPEENGNTVEKRNGKE